MFGFSLPEIIFLAVLALVVIGPKQLPEVARTLGRFINELRRTTSVFSEDLKSQVRMDTSAFDITKPLPPKPKKPAEAATPPLDPHEPVQQELKIETAETPKPEDKNKA